jgi:hypothetical protein
MNSSCGEGFRVVAAGVAIAAASAHACGPHLQHKTIEMQPIGTAPEHDRTPKDEGNDAGVTAPNAGTPVPGNSSVCAGSEIDPLDDALKQCDAPLPRAADLPSGMRDKLEVRVTPSASQIPPGGHVEVTVVIRNKSNDSVPLFFSGDPLPRFEVEAFDAKGKRVDLPPGKAPPWPKGVEPAKGEVKAQKVMLDKGGVARVKVSWDAVKTKWAPDKAKVWDARGFPRVPSGPLPAGKYTLRVVVPILNDLDIPKIPIDVSG